MRYLHRGARLSSCSGFPLYLLFLDESGTHGGSPVFVLAGLAIHESDAQDLQRRVEDALADVLPDGCRSDEFEIHGSEIRSPKGRSQWHRIPFPLRARALDRLVRSVGTFTPRDTRRPFALFGAVVDRAIPDQEERAYTDVLHKFQSFLYRLELRPEGFPEQGLVVHDRRVVEPDIQTQTQKWRRASSRIGQLTHLADVPLFADSRASRLIQVSDLVCYALWRYYGLDTPDTRYMSHLWPLFDSAGGVMHGLAHVWPGFGRGTVCCPACRSRSML